MEKPLNEFCKDNKSIDGLNKYCKSCTSILFKVWRKNNLDKDKKRVNKYHTDNKTMRKEYYLKNKVKIQERQRKYQKSKRHKNIEYKISVMLRKRLTAAIKNNKDVVKGKTFNLLGCTIKEFKIYLESLFLIGMSWENHGPKGWHIDHIIPCATFDLTDHEQQKKCFHYTNLQPLWWYDNLKKGAKINASTN